MFPRGRRAIYQLEVGQGGAGRLAGVFLHLCYARAGGCPAGQGSKFRPRVASAYPFVRLVVACNFLRTSGRGGSIKGRTTAAGEHKLPANLVFGGTTRPQTT
jgi:hypothetical protein